MRGPVLIGSGGHSASITDILTREIHVPPVGYIDIGNTPRNNLLLGPRLGNDELIPSLVARSERFILAIGAVELLEVRRRIFSQVAGFDAFFPAVRSTSAVVSANVTVGAGTVIHKSAVVNVDVTLGQSVTVNSGAIVEHGSRIDDAALISPGAIVAGNCQVGEFAFIGAGAILFQGVRIGAGAIVAAGAVVRSDVSPGATFRN